MTRHECKADKQNDININISSNLDNYISDHPFLLLVRTSERYRNE